MESPVEEDVYRAFRRFWYGTAKPYMKNPTIRKMGESMFATMKGKRPFLAYVEVGGEIRVLHMMMATRKGDLVESILSPDYGVPFIVKVDIWISLVDPRMELSYTYSRRKVYIDAHSSMLFVCGDRGPFGGKWFPIHVIGKRGRKVSYNTLSLPGYCSVYPFVGHRDVVLPEERQVVVYTNGEDASHYLVLCRHTDGQNDWFNAFERGLRSWTPHLNPMLCKNMALNEKAQSKEYEAPSGGGHRRVRNRRFKRRVSLWRWTKAWSRVHCLRMRSMLWA